MNHKIKISIIFKSFWLIFFLSFLIVMAPLILSAQTLDDVDNVHPAWTLSQLRPKNWEVQVTGLALLPDGKLVVLEMHEPGNNQSNNPMPNGRLFLVTNPTVSDPEKIQYLKIADSLREPVGILVKDGKIYVSEKNELNEYTLNPEQTRANKTRTIATIPHDKDGRANFQEYPFGVIYKAGYFYVANGGAVHDGGWAFDGAMNELSEDRVGCVLKISEADGSIIKLNAGMRATNGITWGPEGNIWVTDNQGSYRPSSQLTVITEGKNLGYPNKPGLYSAEPVTPPSLWLPHGEIGRSPTYPILVSHGIYTGQFLVGDLSQGGIKRAFVEKVGTDWQGAVFSFTGGLEVGVQSVIELADGSLYFGGLGNGDEQNWGWRRNRFGMQKLSPKPGVLAFEILSIRSRKNGMEVEFTKPIGPEGDLKASYIVQSAIMKPESGYGKGNMEDRKDLTITAVKVSDDRKKAFLETALVPQRVLVIKATGVKSSTGEILRCPAGWYTLNSISNSEPFTNTVAVKPTRQNIMPLVSDFKISVTKGGAQIALSGSGSHEIIFKSLNGKILWQKSGSGSKVYTISLERFGHGVFLVEGIIAGNKFSKRELL